MTLVPKRSKPAAQSPRPSAATRFPDRTTIIFQTICLIAALSLLVPLRGAPAQANKVCTNGQCISCNGPVACVNGACTCNGVPVGAAMSGGEGTVVQAGPCGGEQTLVHANGGGVVSVTASVAPSVFVSNDSAVCGRASVSGSSRLVASVVNGAVFVSDSTLTHSVMNGAARATHSQITNSTLNGAATATNSEIVNSVFNGRASIVDRRIQNAVIND